MITALNHSQSAEFAMSGHFSVRFITAMSGLINVKVGRLCVFVVATVHVLAADVLFTFEVVLFAFHWRSRFGLADGGDADRRGEKITGGRSPFFKKNRNQHMFLLHSKRINT